MFIFLICTKEYMYLFKFIFSKYKIFVVYCVGVCRFKLHLSPVVLFSTIKITQKNIFAFVMSQLNS